MGVGGEAHTALAGETVDDRLALAEINDDDAADEHGHDDCDGHDHFSEMM